MGILAAVLGGIGVVFSALFLWQLRRARVRNLSITIGYLVNVIAAPPLRSRSELRAAVRTLRQAVRDEPPGPVKANLTAAEALLSMVLERREAELDEVLDGPLGDLRSALQESGIAALDHPRVTS
jgi:hypothetical protein